MKRVDSDLQIKNNPPCKSPLHEMDVSRKHGFKMNQKKVKEYGGLELCNFCFTPRFCKTLDFPKQLYLNRSLQNQLFSLSKHLSTKKLG